MSVKCRVMKSGLAEITQGYGGANNHLGIDLVNQGYTLGGITAHSEGVVSYVQTGYGNAKGSSGMASYGNMVKIDHSNGNITLYAHLASVAVKTGQKVAKGQEIGYMGDSGNAYGGHLHFEVFVNGNRTDPSPYLDADFPSPVTQDVKRDETKDQLQVNKMDLRVRKAPATNQPILGLAKEWGIYNYYEVKEQGGYTWYRIADNQWVAHTEDWCTIMPKKEPKDPEIEALELQISTLEKEKQELKDRNKLLEQEIVRLREEESEYIIFEAPKEALYGINLKKGEIVKYLKD